VRKRPSVCLDGGFPPVWAENTNGFAPVLDPYALELTYGNQQTDSSDKLATAPEQRKTYPH
jgi:hypothetical protein